MKSLEDIKDTREEGFAICGWFPGMDLRGSNASFEALLALIRRTKETSRVRRLEETRYFIWLWAMGLRPFFQFLLDINESGYSRSKVGWVVMVGS